MAFKVGEETNHDTIDKNKRKMHKNVFYISFTFTKHEQIKISTQ